MKVTLRQKNATIAGGVTPTKWILRLATLFLLFMVVTPAHAGRPLVITSIHPLTLIADELAGDWAEIRQLLPDGELPHHFSLNLSQRQLIDDADLLVWVGPALEGFLERPIRARPPDTVLTALQLRPVRALGPPVMNGPLDVARVDPHIWLDPDWGIAVGVAIADWLAGRFPRYQPEILTALTTFTGKLRDFSGDLAAEFSGYRGRRYIADHAAFSHFTAKYGIEFAGSLHDDSGLAKGVRAMQELAGETGISCVVAEPAYDRRQLDRVAATLNVKALNIDPLGADIASGPGAYHDLLKTVAAGFRECFSAG